MQQFVLPNAARSKKYCGKAEGNRVLAAHLLGVSRRTLFYKLRVHGIT